MYRARDVSLSRDVAVKLLHAALAEDQAFLRRFRAEAQSAAMLSHPHVVSVFDWGEDDGEPYLVLEYLAGGSLRRLLDGGHLLSVPQAAALARDAAGALAYAHGRHLVHRDVKPANVLFGEDGRLRMADFGVARALAEAAWTEPVGAMVGTARYASPEQAQGKLVDGRADVYSLGLVVVEAVTGAVPFATDTTIGTLMARVGARLEPPEELGPLGPIVERASFPDPDGRPASTTLFRELEELCLSLGAPEPLPLEGDVLSLEDEPTQLGVRSHSVTLPGGDPEDITIVSEVVPLDSAPAGSSLGPPAGSLVGDPSGELDPGPAVYLPDRGDEDAEVAPGRRTRRRRWPYVLVVLLLVIGGAAYGLDRTVLVPSYHVPNILGDTPTAAATALSASHFTLQVTGKQWSASVPAGKVAAQAPLASSQLRSGSTVDAVISKGPAPRDVPDVKGKDQVSAVAALAQLGFRHKASYVYSETIPSGRVISYSPQGRRSYRTVVSLTVSEGPKPRTIPDLSSDTYSQAASALKGIQLVPSRQQEYSTTVPAGQVIDTVPSAGQQVNRGATVSVVVSLGPQLVPVPSGLIGETVSQAEKTLSNDGLGVGNIYGPSNKGARVFATDPPAGTKVGPGTAVDLYTI